MPGGREEDLGQFVVSAENNVAIDAEIVEGSAFKAILVETTEESAFTHFLDGTQRAWLVAYVGLAPAYLAHTSAGLLERVDREIVPPEEEFYSGNLDLVVPDYAALPPVAGIGFLPVGAGLEETEISLRQRIANAISARREERETEVARRFRDGWLLIDGGIGKVLERVPEGVQVVGVVKSHQRQYFASRERVRIILDLKPGERTPVFLRERNQMQGREAYSFYLKLRDSDDQGPLFGLIRVEMPISQSFVERADEIAGWLLAERAPLSLPDARYDRMIYPIRLVEKHLKARQPSEPAIRAILGI